MGCGHQGPFPVHPLHALNRNRSRPLAPLLCPKTGSTTVLRHGIDHLACFGSEFSLHLAPGIQAFGWPAPRWQWPLAVLLPVGGDVGIQLPLLASFQIGGAAVAGVGDQGIRQLSVGLDPLARRQ